MTEYIIKESPLDEYPLIIFAGSYRRLVDYFPDIEIKLSTLGYIGPVLLDQFACNGPSSRFACVRFNGRKFDLTTTKRVMCAHRVVSYCDDVLLQTPDVLEQGVVRFGSD